MNPNLQRIEATLSQISPQIDAQRAALNRRAGSAKGSISFTVSAPPSSLATTADSGEMDEATTISATTGTATGTATATSSTKLDLPAFAPLKTETAIAPAISPTLATGGITGGPTNGTTGGTTGRATARVTATKPAAKPVAKSAVRAAAKPAAPSATKSTARSVAKPTASSSALVNAAQPSAPPLHEDNRAIAPALIPQVSHSAVAEISHDTSVHSPVSASARPFPKRDSAAQPFELPKFKLPDFSNSRHVTNPEFVLGLLKELETIVSAWHKELQRVRLSIQDLYLEGPVIDGWLESQSHEPAYSGAATLRHAEIDRLMEYVEEICRQPATATEGSSIPSAMPPKAVRADYRLCGLDADGQLWSRPCPAEQVPNVGLAIARYQKLRQLLGQQRNLEGQLNTFAQSLITFHRDIASGQ